MAPDIVLVRGHSHPKVRSSPREICGDSQFQAERPPDARKLAPDILDVGPAQAVLGVEHPGLVEPRDMVATREATDMLTIFHVCAGMLLCQHLIPQNTVHPH